MKNGGNMKKYLSMHRFVFVPIVLLIGMASMAGAAPLDVYSNNFDGTEVMSPGVTGGMGGSGGIESVQGYGSYGFSVNLWRNATVNPAGSTILSLNNLPAHDSVDISFLLAFIDSWDSTDGTVTPDYFNVKVDGINVLQITANNQSGSVNYGGTLLTPVPRLDLGWNWRWGDQGFDMANEPALFLAHTGNALSVEFFASGAGWQGTSDESWGIENLKVTVNTTSTSVPEPATMLLFVTGIAGLAVTRLRRKRQ
jgi:hypothetical protein